MDEKMRNMSLKTEEFDSKIMRRVIAREHSQMPRTCDSCGGDMEFERQFLLTSPERTGDLLIYRCKKCNKTIKKFFEFPKEYARHFREERSKP